MARSTLMRHRNLISLRMRLRDPEEGGGGGSEGGGSEGAGAEGKEGKEGGKYTPPASQEEFDRIFTERLNRALKKYADYDTNKAKAAQFDALERESATDAEKAARTAREEGFNEAMSKQVPRAIKAEFKAAAKEHGLSKEQLSTLLEDLDLVKYADDEGEPDEEKIERKVKAFAPKGKTGSNPKFGQGTRETSTARKGEAGLAEAQRRFPQAAGKS
jgi:hypothetical protein